MQKTLFSLALILIAAGLSAQSPQSRFTYEDRSGTTGHTLVIDGKSFGPYKEIYTTTHSTSGTTGFFLATKRDKVYIVGQGREAGPLGADFQPESTYISDDGKVAAVVALGQYNEEADTTETQLWVNGTLYGPFNGAYPFEYAETGGSWIAGIQRADGSQDVLLNGKSQGPFFSVDSVWMSPDGKNWGYAVSDEDGVVTVVTQDRRYDAPQSVNFDYMAPRAPHWAYSIRTGDDEELIIVDGKEYKGYLNFSGLYTSYSGRHWAFQAEKLTDTGDYPVVLINGKEYIGDNLNSNSLGSQEWFSWSIRDGNKVVTQVLVLP